MFKAHRPVYHSALGWRVIKKKKKNHANVIGAGADALQGYLAHKKPATPLGP